MSEKYNIEEIATVYRLQMTVLPVKTPEDIFTLPIALQQ